MEPWQRRHIRENLVQLQEFTIYNSLLKAHILSKEVLHQADLDSIDEKGCTGKSLKFYEIVQTRSNAYEKLVEVLFHCRQSGALKILLEGFRIHKISHVLQRCNLPFNPDLIISAEVEFKGSSKKIFEIFKNLSVEDLKDILDDSECQQDYLDIFVTKEKEFKLLTDTIPTLTSFYIPRSISNRLRVDPNIFKKNSKDIYVFKGLTRSKLSNIAKPNSTSTSTKQLTELTSRFILLDYEDDWCKLKKIAKHPIHLIDVEEGEEGNNFYLEDSVGGLVVPPGSLDSSYLFEDAYISEDKFLDRLNSSPSIKTVCICDTPGMGKSWLLASLARKRDHPNTETIVGFFPLNKLIVAYKNSEDDEVLKTVLNFISASTLSREILLWALKAKLMNLELFFYGFDEILDENFDQTKIFLKEILEADIVAKVYVTSRPHLRQELETTIGAISYNILPFTEENQVEYLVKSWKEKHPNSVESKLSKFADHCLRDIQFTCKSRDIMGVPLQCYLISEVFSNEAKLYSDPTRQQEYPIISPTSLYGMYKELIRQRFNSVYKQDKEIIPDVKKFHIWKALQLICPKIGDDYSRMECLNQTDNKFDYYAAGILTSDISHVSDSESNSPQFIHRTFAEFLIAEYIGDVLMTQVNDGQEHKILENISAISILNEFLSTKSLPKDTYWLFLISFECFTWKFSVISYFLNAHLSSCESQLVSKSISEFLNTQEPSKIFQILSACVYNNQIHLFRVLTNMIKSLGEPLLQSFKSYMITMSPLSTPTYPISGTKVDQLVILISLDFGLNMMQECLKFIKDLICDENEIWKRLENTHLCPLRFSLLMGDYDLVEYLIDKFSYEHYTLLYYCVDCFYSGGKISKSKLELCKFLVLRWKNDLPSALDIKDRLTKLCYSPYIHVDLIKYLVEEGADLKLKILDSQNIVHRTAVYMSGDDFYEFCFFLINTCKASNLIKPNNSRWQHPLDFILIHGKDVQARTVDLILNIPGNNAQDYNYQKCHRNLITSALHKRLGVDILKLLVKHGADYSYKQWRNRTMLHVAAEMADEESIEYLLSLGLSVNEQDHKKLTPLLGVFSYHRKYESDGLDIVKLLINKGADISAVDSENENIAHQAAKSLMDQERFENFVRFISELENGWEIFGRRNINLQNPLRVRLTKRLGITNKTLELIFQNSNIDINAADKDGNSILLLANDNLKVIKFLVEHGADIYQTDKNGDTIAHKSTQTLYGDTFHKFVELLMWNSDASKILGVRNNQEQTVLHFALNRGGLKEETLEALLKVSEVNINAADNYYNYGNTLFLNAVNHNGVNILKVLVKHGADVTISNRLNENALHIVLHNSRYFITERTQEVVEYLVSSGVDLTQKDYNGQRPLDIGKTILSDVHSNRDKHITDDQVKILQNIIVFLEKYAAK